MMKAMHGVNLGGWLVLERWIAPSLFKGTRATDEYSLCKELGLEEATKRLTKHRETFITEDHIKQIADMGLSLLRIPVGYWLFGGKQPYVDGAESCLDNAMSWAEQYGLKVILDFHAAPGSQNGWDHSGKSGEIAWDQRANITASLAFIDQLTKKYGADKTLIGVEPLNEPHWDVNLTLLVEYYRQASVVIQSNCHSDVMTVVSDAFRPERMSKALRKAEMNVVLDIHLYQLFTPEDRALDLLGHLRKTNKEWSKLLSKLSRHHTLLVGEWSAAMSELYNELGEPQRRYDQAAYLTYAREQQNVFLNSGASWTYWTARTEDGGAWSLLDHPDYLQK